MSKNIGWGIVLYVPGDFIYSYTNNLDDGKGEIVNSLINTSKSILSGGKEWIVLPSDYNDMGKRRFYIEVINENGVYLKNSEGETNENKSE